MSDDFTKLDQFASAIEDANLLIHNQETVEALQRAILAAPRDLQTLSHVLLYTIRQYAYVDRIDPHRMCRFQYNRDEFIKFIEDELPKGLKSDEKTIRHLIKDFPETLAAFDAATRPPKGGNYNPEGKNQHGKEEEVYPDNIRIDQQADQTPAQPEKPTPKKRDRTNEPPAGTSTSYAHYRLRKERPDLLDRVVKGELSCNAAMIEAGFRKTPSPLDTLRKAWAKATAEEKDTLLDAVDLDDLRRALERRK